VRERHQEELGDRADHHAANGRGSGHHQTRASRSATATSAESIDDHLRTSPVCGTGTVRHRGATTPPASDGDREGADAVVRPAAGHPEQV
jgi:hypothetical protein